MGNYLILIIDDDPVEHEVLGEYLNLYGYELIHAEDGRQGIEIMVTKRPDLVLLDIQMPEMDGFETIAEIKKDPDLEELPVLFLTSLDSHHLKVKGLELGADDFVTKPYNKAELLARVRVALRRSQRYRSRLNAALSGSLSHIGLAEVLQTLHIGQKTATVFLKEIDGEIVMERGQLIHSKQGAFTGQSALCRIFFLEKGTFSVDFSGPPAELPRKAQSMQAALMDVMTCVDETKKILEGVAGDNPMIEPGESLKEYTAIERISDLFPLPLHELLILMEGDLKDNAEEIVAAVKNEGIRVVN